MSRMTRNRNKSNNFMDLQASTSSKTDNDPEYSNMYLELEQLRSLNLELAKKNAELKSLNGIICKDRLELMNEVHSLKIQLEMKKKSAMELHGKVVELSHIAMSLILSPNQDEMFGYQSKTYKSNKPNGTCEPEPSSAKSSPNSSQTGGSNNNLNVQQTRAVKPMISGHTIDRPVINLQRVSQAHLQRLSDRVRQGNVNETEEIETDANTLLEFSNTEILPVENDIIEENSIDEGVTNLPQTSREYQALETVLEETETNSTPSTSLVDNAIPNESVSLNIGRRRNISPQPNLLPAALNSLEGNDSNGSQSLSFSLLDISNTLAAAGHVTVRRGVNKRRNITSVSQNRSNSMSVSSASSLCLSNRENDTTIVQNLINDGNNLSDSQFMDDLNFRDIPVTSTPAVVIDPTKRSRKSKDGSHDSSTPKPPQTRKCLKRCSVILKRISEPKRRSSSPKKKRTRQSSANKVSDTKSEAKDDDCTISTPGSSNIESSPRKRPSRKTKPKNLKEPPIGKKLRR